MGEVYQQVRRMNLRGIWHQEKMEVPSIYPMLNFRFYFPFDEMYHGSWAFGGGPPVPAFSLEKATRPTTIDCLYCWFFSIQPCKSGCPLPRHTINNSQNHRRDERFTLNQYQYERYNRLISDRLLWLFSGFRGEKIEHRWKLFYSRQHNCFWFCINLLLL